MQPSPRPYVDDASRADVYRALFDALDEGIVFHDRDGRVVFANPAAGHILGVSTDDLLGQTSRDGAWDATLEDGQAAPASLHPAVQTRLTGEPQRDVLMQVSRPDGTRIWVSINTRAVPTSDGAQVAGVVVSFTDVTRRREAEERVVRSEAWLRELLRHSSDLTIVTDATGIVTYVSESSQRLWGYEASEWIGGTGHEVLHPDDLEYTLKSLANAIADPDRNEPMELRVRHADGSWRTVEILANNLLDSPEIRGVIANVRDVTDLRAAQLQISADARRFEAMLTNLDDVVTVVDANANITFVSPNIERLLGRRPEDRNGASILDYVHPDDVDRVVEMLAAGLGTPGPAERFEARLRREDGVYRVWEVAATNLLDDPDIRGIIINSRDVTDRVESEAALRHAENERHRQEVELERRALETQLTQAQRLESLGRLAGGVAHDFNNLLAVILSYAIFTAKKLGADSLLADDVAQIRRAAEQAAELTGKLLLFGRSDETEPQILDLNTIVENAVQLVERTLSPNTRLRLALESRPCAVRVDPSQIEQALVNLILNANDALVDGGTITVTTERGNDVAFTVADDGVGMRADVVEHAFEPFFTTKAVGDGSGLGLAIAQNVVARSGGAIAIESEVGRGTVVRVTLPEADDPAPPNPSTNAAPKPRKVTGETVLLVEDDRRVREVARRILSDGGYNVIPAPSGAAALAVLETQPDIALLLTDVVMPGMSGAELAEQTLHLRPEIEIVFMTAYAYEHLTSGRPSPVVIRKPFTPDELLNVVGAHLDRS